MAKTKRELEAEIQAALGKIAAGVPGTRYGRTPRDTGHGETGFRELFVEVPEAQQRGPCADGHVLARLTDGSARCACGAVRWRPRGEGGSRRKSGRW